MEIADAGPLGSALVFAAEPRSVCWARQHVACALSAWGVDDEVIYLARLLATELVTNAVTASADDRAVSASMPPASDGRIALRLRLAGAVVRICVRDGSPQPPLARAATAEDEAGRGLTVIAALARQWDFCPGKGGKVVWCDIGTGG